jgi:hypothetical protein
MKNAEIVIIVFHIWKQNCLVEDSFQKSNRENMKFFNAGVTPHCDFLQLPIGMGFLLNCILQCQRHQKFIGVVNGEGENVDAPTKRN